MLQNPHLCLVTRNSLNFLLKYKYEIFLTTPSTALLLLAGAFSHRFWLVRFEHAHVSYLPLSLRVPGFNSSRLEKRANGLD